MGDVTFTDHESGDMTGGGKFTLSYSQITLELWRRCLQLSCVEFRGGYTNKTISGNIEVEQYVSSSTEAWINAVWALYDACLPKFDDKMKESATKYIKELDELEKEDEEGKRLLVKTIFQELTKLLGRLRFFEGGRVG